MALGLGEQAAAAVVVVLLSKPLKRVALLVSRRGFVCGDPLAPVLCVFVYIEKR